ncbi:hypothetical protein ABIB82_007737 [Bradyrhizobium sp. i1.8.4]
MNRTLKEAIAQRYHYETHRQLEDHPAVFLDAYNFARRLKTLSGLTPYEAICKAWVDERDRFRIDPLHLTSGHQRTGIPAAGPSCFGLMNAANRLIAMALQTQFPTKKPTTSVP